MSNLKAKFALWEQKAKKDTPKGPTMRPGSRVSSYKNIFKQMRIAIIAVMHNVKIEKHSTKYYEIYFSEYEFQTSFKGDMKKSSKMF